ncbi:MAG TPA: SDR family NAD(P)-dependent oxidoreductase, partial [Nitrososphaera sp.]|nr:SDR family NAD(P)-dependent oxidoreductase [Nitrososphaera sp.]
MKHWPTCQKGQTFLVSQTGPSSKSARIVRGWWSKIMEQRIDKHKFGPWAIVTGASSGIGREFARQIAWNGMHLVLVARRLRLLEEARAYFEKTYGIQCRIVQADLSKDGFLDKIELATK